MRFTGVFIALFLTLAVSAAPNPQNRGGNGGNRGGVAQGGKGGQGGQGNGGKGGKGTGAGGANNGTSTVTSTGASTGTSTGATNGTDTTVGAGTGSVDTGNAGNATAAASCGSSDPQSSLCLDPKVIAPGFANNGQDVPTAGQVASATSTNNFINACLLTPNLPLTNGQQIKTGSCNPAPMGVIPSTDNMPSSKFTFPTNGQTIPANQAFTISMAINNLETGNFVNANENYFSAPQALNDAGQIKGHSHVVVEKLTALDQTTPTNPNVFAFFKGLNGAAQGGILTAAVTNGLPAGFYKVSSINTAANHQPCLVPIAQHGSLDDVVYFTISDSASGSNATDTGAAATGTATGSATDNTAAADNVAANDAATTTSAASTSTAAAAGSTGAASSKSGKGQTGSGGQGGQGNKGGQGGQGNNKGKGGGK